MLSLRTPPSTPADFPRRRRIAVLYQNYDEGTPCSNRTAHLQRWPTYPQAWTTLRVRHSGQADSSRWGEVKGATGGGSVSPVGAPTTLMPHAVCARAQEAFYVVLTVCATPPPNSSS